VETATLQRALSQFGDEQIATFDRLTVGVSNETFMLSCTSGRRYAMRRIRLQTVDSVRAEVRIQQLLRAHGLGTPIYLRGSGGESIAEVDGAHFTVAEFVDGKHPATTTLELVTDMGATMATMHHALDQLSTVMRFNTGQWLDPRNAELDIRHIEHGMRVQLASDLAATRRVFELGLPSAVIHGEFATNNIFAENDRVTVIFDFETAQYAPRLLDIAFTWLSIVYDGELAPRSVLTTLIAGYASAAGPLTDHEGRHVELAVRYVSTAAAAWCFRRGHDEYGHRFLAAVRELPTGAG
jgi:Ser/Thr protein kinase RdoA (MazF antagonist)